MGCTSDMEAIRAAAARHGLLVIEDAAHALGSELGGEPCGRLGDAACFSFFPNKNMTTGEGGMIVFREDDAAAAARSLRSHAMTTLTWLLLVLFTGSVRSARLPGRVLKSQIMYWRFC